MDPKASIVLPAYNEAGTIEDSVKKVRTALFELDRSFEIIIAENGSTDGTDRISKQLSQEYEGVSFLHTKKGRGNALRAAFKKANGDVILYMD
ncbi:MAG: glycosyltransferase family 2 protein, partial [Candidatus Hydrothermarchaeales archaeon]